MVQVIVELHSIGYLRRVGLAPPIAAMVNMGDEQLGPAQIPYMQGFSPTGAAMQHHVESLASLRRGRVKA